MRIGDFGKNSISKKWNKNVKHATRTYTQAIMCEN